MPARYVPGPGEFAQFKEQLLARGFTQIEIADAKKLNRKSGISKSAENRDERETGFVLCHNGYNVVVWTTWIEDTHYVRDRDTAWVLILRENKIVYCSRPIHRTRNFLWRLLMCARIARWRVLKRPKCPSCNALMHIAMGLALKSRYWLCDKEKAHDGGKIVCREWDFEMNFPPDVVRFIRDDRMKRAWYRERARREGKDPAAALKRRVARIRAEAKGEI